MSAAAARGSNAHNPCSHHNTIGSQISNIARAVQSLCREGQIVLVAHHPAGQLGSAREIVEQVKLGAVDMTVTDTAYMSMSSLSWQRLQLPFLFSGWEHAERAMDGEPGKVVSELLQQKNHGVRAIAFMHNGFRDVMSVKKPMSSIDDFKGVKFRSPPIPIWVKMFEAPRRHSGDSRLVRSLSGHASRSGGRTRGTAEGFVNSKLFEVGNLWRRRVTCTI